MEHSQLNDSVLQKIKADIRGTVISPSDASYDEARSVYNGMIDRRPALIVKCSNVADIINCLRYGQELTLPIAIRGGGHNAGGLGICDHGLVIDLSPMKGIRIDLKSNTVRAEAGCLLGELDHATSAFGKAVPTGILSTTGISGLTLGGGLGHLTRMYGLTIDHLLEADVVLANGRLVTASETENSDLFWAIRGGGGNFGVVTSFLFRLQNVENIYGGPMLWHISDSEEMMKYYREFILNAPDEIYGYFAFLTVPPVPLFPEELHLKKMCGIVWCNVGGADTAVKAVDQFRLYKKPALDYAGPIPYYNLQRMFDALYPKGLQWYWKAHFIKDLPDESIKLNVRFGNKLPTPHSTMHLYPVNGAAHKRGKEDTAWSYRDANWAQVIVGVDPDHGNREIITSWAREYWQALIPYSAGGAYINFLMEEGEERVRASYRDNYGKLAKIKAKYDPGNLFRVNQNILPKGA